MGEYADDYYRRDVINKHGFDPGSMYNSDNRPTKQKIICPRCGKRIKTDQGVDDHLRDYHSIPQVHNAKL
jgi:hypothetical protein